MIFFNEICFVFSEDHLYIGEDSLFIKEAVKTFLNSFFVNYFFVMIIPNCFLLNRKNFQPSISRQ